jgi:hypothetical protein
MAEAHVAAAPNPAHALGFPVTHRKDGWWVGPLLTFLGLSAFGVYATFRAIYNDQYHVGPGTGSHEMHAYMLSPFYSPLLTGLIPQSIGWLSPAFLILWAPGGFRVTCYYYRKAYYRAFFLDPVGCAVGEPNSLCGARRGHEYKGETRLLLFQNLHRYFMYLALLFLVLLSIDFVDSCIWPTPSGGHTFGISLGSIVLLANVTLLTLYTFSCHSLRHLIGGGLDCFSKDPLSQLRFKLWVWVSALNRNHMLWAWVSLFMVAFADLYVWLVASGTIRDPAVVF